MGNAFRRSLEKLDEESENEDEEECGEDSAEVTSVSVAAGWFEKSPAEAIGDAVDGAAACGEDAAGCRTGEGACDMSGCSAPKRGDFCYMQT